MERVIKYLPMAILLLLASTMIFLVLLIPASIAKFEISNIEFIVLFLVVIVSTVASMVALMFYLLLTKKIR